MVSSATVALLGLNLSWAEAVLYLALSWSEAELYLAPSWSEAALFLTSSWSEAVLCLAESWSEAVPYLASSSSEAVLYLACCCIPGSILGLRSWKDAMVNGILWCDVSKTPLVKKTESFERCNGWFSNK